MDRLHDRGLLHAGLDDLGEERGHRPLPPRLPEAARPGVRLPVVDRRNHRRPEADRGASAPAVQPERGTRSEEHTSELQSLKRISYAVFSLKKKKQKTQETH